MSFGPSTHDPSAAASPPISSLKSPPPPPEASPTTAGPVGQQIPMRIGQCRPSPPSQDPSQLQMPPTRLSARSRILMVPIVAKDAAEYVMRTRIRMNPCPGPGAPADQRCDMQDKKFRSIQEHIRRAHPENYIPKLPATEESFRQMVNTPPSARPPTLPAAAASSPATAPSQRYSNPAYGHDRDSFGYRPSASAIGTTLEDQYPAAATAAVALAQLHNHRPDPDWDSDADYASETDMRRRMHPSVELPPIQAPFPHQQQQHHGIPDPRPRELLPPVMGHSPPERSSTLPPIERRESLQRRERGGRPRKPSITQNSRKPKHEKGRSRDHGGRLNIDGRKAFSAEPPAMAAAAVKSRRWEDLIEAATSATEADSDRDITPTPQSPMAIKRASLPPLHPAIAQNQSYKASPLARTLTPPPPHVLSGPPLFPSSEGLGRSIDSTTSAHSSHTSTSGQNFHIPSTGLSSSDTMTSPTYYNAQHASSGSQSSVTSGAQVQIYCANCRRPSVLTDSFACTECISGFCTDCVWTLNGDVRTGVSARSCPKCRTVGARYRPIRLEIR